MALTFDALRAILSSNKAYLNQDGTINHVALYKLAQKCDHYLVDLLTSHDETRIEFFLKRGSYHVFVRDLFIDYISHKNFLANSYTKYATKIGLHDGKDFIKKNSDVVLAFPFKDCVLEGGQTKDDEKRKEIYYNEVLAREEIDRLLDTKVLTNASRYSAHKNIQPLDAFCRDAETNKARGTSEHTITDNLIIKGNNLIAMHSIKHHFRGKIKLIYIDPPYNPANSLNNTFCYNNNFNRSTWLVFMKNRLEIARELLTKDGVLIIAIDDNERDYLGVLLKEIFNEHETHCITIVHNPRGVQGTNFSYTHEYAFFVIPKGKKTIINQEIDKEDITWSNFRNWGTESLRSDAKNCFYPIIISKTTKEIIAFGNVCEDSFVPKSRMIEKDDGIYIYPVDDGGIERKWRYARQSVESVQHLLRAREVKGVWDIQIGKDFRQYPTVWQHKKYDANEYGTKLIKSLVPDCEFDFPKSLWTVYDCMYAVVGEDKNAIIVDYHAGSGTTAHAVLALNKKDGGNRQFILIEQMDYIETVTSKRIQRVIETEQLKTDFVYLELKKHNHMFLDRIAEATTTDALVALQKDIVHHAFIDYRLDLDEIEQEQEAFKALTLAEQKSILCGFLDSNQMYVNYSERDDEHYACSDHEKRVSEDFYR